MKGYKAQLKNIFFEIMLLPQLEYEYFNGHGKHNGKKKKIQTHFHNKSQKTNRSSHWRCSVKKKDVIFKNFANFT